MEKKQIYALAKWLSNPDVTKERLRTVGAGAEMSLWNLMLARLKKRHGEVIRAIGDLLERPGEMLGLSASELVDVALKLQNKEISRLVYHKISPALQDKHPELAEAAVGASTGPGTSFTSTANVAAYPVPIGMMAPGRKKKKKNSR